MFASTSLRGSNPRDRRSAGFYAEATCRQLFISVKRCISPIRLATNASHLLEDELIQFSVIVESDQRTISMWAMLTDSRTLFNSRDSSNSADNSSLGNDTALSGATRDLEHNSSVRN